MFRWRNGSKRSNYYASWVRNTFTPNSKIAYANGRTLERHIMVRIYNSTRASSPMKLSALRNVSVTLFEYMINNQHLLEQKYRSKQTPESLSKVVFRSN
mmetsp:Transcript_31614/g.74400  ORF Transcript_31614/g.74400 Transcript_31614/m.74400 type:complete len:99 (+) Transcript_31614:1227-1523(+)